MNEEKSPMRTLALDLGPSSIGWALVDEAKQQIVAIGARVFPEGVADYGTGKEAPKNQTRRTKRGLRRQVQRRARRKRNLRHALVHAGFFPPEAALPATDQTRLAWEKANFEPNIYDLRNKALSEKLSRIELGRVFLHLAQRRGFQSNRKTDKGKQKEVSETLKEISTLEASIQDASKRTLGEYLSSLQAANPHERIRGKHTRRDMLVKEFDAIWEAQSTHHPELLTNALKTGEQGPASFPSEAIATGGKPADLLRRFGMRGMIFFQRKMYWPESAIGRCEIDPTQPRCPRADRAAQEFRLLQELNNLRLIMPDGEIRPLDDEQYSTALNFLQTKESVKFEELAKKLHLQPNTGFNLQAGERSGIHGMETDYVLRGKKYFGPKVWDSFSDEKKNAIVRAILEPDEAKGHAALADPSWQIDPNLIETLLAAHLPEGHSNYGQQTIEKLLPFLRQRMPLLTADERCAIHAAGFKAPWERDITPGQYLPMPPKITNPLVRQAIFEVRKLVNAIVKEYGKPDVIHVELAREVKGNSIQRDRQSKEMRARKAKRDAAFDEIRAAGVKPSGPTIDRYLLWKEQRELCMYSKPDRIISLTQLLGGEVDIDHILPESLSLDHSLMNKVVCFRSENADKGQRTVHEWLAGTKPEKYEAILQRAAKLDIEIRNRKLPRFSQPTCKLEDFINRQLTDTAYITRTVVTYLRHLCPDVLGTKGQLTARLRHDWGLDTILNPEGKGAKTRDDHRHHAIDAVVIALTNRSRLQQLAKTCRQDLDRVPLPEPWPGFRDQVADKIGSLLVSHRVPQGIYGPLHDETIYGATQQIANGTKGHRPWAKNWIEEDKVYVQRKFLKDLSLSEVGKIRDERIRELVVARLKQFNITPRSEEKDKEDEDDPKGSNKIPNAVWKDLLLLYPRKGEKTGTPTVIKKVRITKRDDSILRLREGGKAFVKPNRLHHVAIFEIVDPTGKKKRVARFVSMLDAAKLKQDGKPVVQRTHPDYPGARFIMTLRRGDLVIGAFKGKERLLVLRRMVSTEQKFRFVEHTDARPSAKATPFNVSLNKLIANKVFVDILGRLKPADA